MAPVDNGSFSEQWRQGQQECRQAKDLMSRTIAGVL